MKKKTNKMQVIQTEKKKTVFNIPSDEARTYLTSIIKDVHEIMKNDKFMEATKKVKLSKDATIVDYERVVKETIPSKIYNFLMLFFDDCYDNVVRILSAIFITDFEEYKKKTIEEMCHDIASLNLTEMSRVVGFFIR